MNIQIKWEDSPKGTTHALVAVMEDALFGWIKSDNDGNYSMYDRINQVWLTCNPKFLSMRELLLVNAPQPNEFLDNLHEQIRKAYEMGYCKGWRDSNNMEYLPHPSLDDYMEKFK